MKEIEIDVLFTDGWSSNDETYSAKCAQMQVFTSQNSGTRLTITLKRLASFIDQQMIGQKIDEEPLKIALQSPNTEVQELLKREDAHRFGTIRHTAWRTMSGGRQNSQLVLVMHGWGLKDDPWFEDKLKI